MLVTFAVDSIPQPQGRMPGGTDGRKEQGRARGAQAQTGQEQEGQGPDAGAPVTNAGRDQPHGARKALSAAVHHASARRRAGRARRGALDRLGRSRGCPDRFSGLTRTGAPDMAITRTAGWPELTVVRMGATAAAAWIRATSLAWCVSTNEMTVPVAPARAVRPERCR